jgi:hypothetical protein
MSDLDLDRDPEIHPPVAAVLYKSRQLNPSPARFRVNQPMRKSAPSVL